MTEENRTQDQSAEAGNPPAQPTAVVTEGELKPVTEPEKPTPEQEEIARVTAELQAALAAAQEQAKAQVARIAELEANYLARSKEAGQLKASIAEAELDVSLSHDNANKAREAENLARADIEVLKAQAKEMREEYGRAISALLEMYRAANPGIPAELITGSTITEVTEAVARARDLVNKVRKLTEQEAGAARVPAGAPGRQPPSTDGLSPRDKIALGIKKKGV